MQRGSGLAFVQDSLQASPAQAQAFKGIVGFNSRYVQPLNGREVLEDSAMDH